MISQVGIALFGLTAIYLANDPNPRRQRWACVAGLASQPFWFTATWEAQQYGIFALCFVYAGLWCRGAWHFWIKRGAA